MSDDERLRAVELDNREMRTTIAHLRSEIERVEATGLRTHHAHGTTRGVVDAHEMRIAAIEAARERALAEREHERERETEAPSRRGRLAVAGGAGVGLGAVIAKVLQWLFPGGAGQ